MKLQIITPEKIVFSEEVEQISLATKDGEITILSHHIPLVTALVSGELKYKKDNQEHILAISGGYAEIKEGNTVVVLTQTAEYAPNIDIIEAEKARDRAIQTMKAEKTLDEIEFATLQATLEKELNRIRVGNKYKKLPPQ